MISYYEIIIT